jgi:hypothetical protein
MILFQFVMCRSFQTSKALAKAPLQKCGVSGVEDTKQVLSNGCKPPKPHFGLPEVQHIGGC